MQFYKKTSIGKSYNYTSLIVKIVLAILALSLIIFFLGKINFPAPNKLIKQEIPRENLKIVK
jgi:VIT1/CCC1 family predicted Fe2+/Mn2+ transporter